MSLNAAPFIPKHWPDYLALEACGVFPRGHSNEGAYWLQAHPNDPYWQAHRICEHKWNWDDFSIQWRNVRILLNLR